MSNKPTPCVGCDYFGSRKDCEECGINTVGKPTLDGLRLREILEGHFGEADKYALDCSESDISKLIADIIGEDVEPDDSDTYEWNVAVNDNELKAEQRQRAKEAGFDL